MNKKVISILRILFVKIETIVLRKPLIRLGMETYKILFKLDNL